jgi:hypothetical protein
VVFIDRYASVVVHGDVASAASNRWRRVGNASQVHRPRGRRARAQRAYYVDPDAQRPVVLQSCT